MCKLNICNYKINDTQNYCHKHTKYNIKDEIESRNGKVCSNFGRRKCVNEVFNDNKRCEKCRHKEQIQSKLRQSKYKKNKLCIKCGKSLDINNVKCKKCLEIQKNIEQNRPKRDRNWTQELLNNPERKEKRDKWQKEYCRTEENKYNDYKKKAEKKERVFEITLEDAKQFFHGYCGYCNDKYNGYEEDSFSSNKLKLNGIDRKDNKKGYTIDNCISCCKNCNFLKGALDPNTLIKRCEHILYYNNEVYIEYYKYDYTIFGDAISGTYNQYKKNALNNKKEFTLTIYEFNIMINDNCYICGKANTKVIKMELIELIMI